MGGDASRGASRPAGTLSRPQWGWEGVTPIQLEVGVITIMAGVGLSQAPISLPRGQKMFFLAVCSLASRGIVGKHPGIG